MMDIFSNNSDDDILTTTRQKIIYPTPSVNVQCTRQDQGSKGSKTGSLC